jgi:hypothetical protein
LNRNAAINELGNEPGAALTRFQGRDSLASLAQFADPGEKQFIDRRRFQTRWGTDGRIIQQGCFDLTEDFSPKSTEYTRGRKVSRARPHL